MRTAKIAGVLILLFAVAMAAGVTAGRLWARQVAPQRAATGSGSPLSEELQLSAQQCEQLRPIWEHARDAARSCANEAEHIQREHEEALKAMLTDDQKSRYAQMSQENHRRIAEQETKRKEAFRQAVAQTEKLLRPDQQRAYETILKNQLGQSFHAEENSADLAR